MLTDSDIRIIESHSKKNLSDTVHEVNNAHAGFRQDTGMDIDKPDDKT